MGSAASSLKKQKESRYNVDETSSETKGLANGADGDAGAVPTPEGRSSQPAAEQIRNEPEPELELEPEPEPELEPEEDSDEPWGPLDMGALERRSGWMDVEIPPLEKDLDPEWETYWFVLVGTVLQVFEIDPGTKQKRGKSKPPKYEFH